MQKRMLSFISVFVAIAVACSVSSWVSARSLQALKRSIPQNALRGLTLMGRTR